MKKISILMLATVFLLAACTKVNQVVKPDEGQFQKITFSANIDESDTKTMLVDGKKVYWNEGDEISVFDNVNLKNNCFKASNVKNNYADFSGLTATEGVESYVAIYPYNASAKWSTSASKYETSIPRYQKAVLGGFDTNLNLAAAKTSSTEMFLSFKNMCALVKVTVPSTMTDITALTLMSGEFLTGRVLFDFDDTGKPLMSKETSTDSGFKEVTLAAENGAALVPGDYYFVVRPSSSTNTTLEDKDKVKHTFTVGITTTSGVVASVKSTTQIDVPANSIINLGSVSLDKASTFRITNAPVGDFPMGVEKFQINYEGNDDKEVTFSQRNKDIATVDADGVVSFTGKIGVAHVFAVCNGVNYPLVFNITKGYYAETFESDEGRKWNLNTSHVNSGATQTWNEGHYMLYQPYWQKTNVARADIIHTAPTYLTRDYPIICFRIDDLKDKNYVEKITIDAIGTTLDESGKSLYKGGIGGTNNSWNYKYKCSDGSSIVVYDLSNKQFVDTKNLLPEGTIEEFGTFQIKYADITQGTASSFTIEDLQFKFYWFRTFASEDALNTFLAKWSAETSITYSK